MVEEWILRYHRVSKGRHITKALKEYEYEFLGMVKSVGRQV